jgi:hypothetical protein
MDLRASISLTSHHNVAPPRLPRSPFRPMISQSTIVELDERICALEEELLCLKRQRNALHPVYSLPAELVVRVFVILQHDTGARIDVADIGHQSLNRNWRWAMNACAYFRNVVRNTPTLWNNIEFRYSLNEWISMCLQLSQDTPLFIRDRDTDGRSTSVFSRARLAQLDGDAVTGDMLNKPAPNLKELVLSYLDEPFSVTRSFLGGASIALTYLHLLGGEISLKGSPEMPFLRCLILELTHMEPKFSLQSLVDLVAHAPRLEIVRIEDLHLGWMEDSEIIEVPGRAVLPNLQTLLIHEKAVVASALLRLFPTPAKHLDIRAHGKGLAQYQVLIHESYLSFLRQLPNHAEQKKGRIILRDLYRIEFGKSHELHATRYNDLDSSASCIIDFDPDVLPFPTIFSVADAITCAYSQEYLGEAADSVSHLRTLTLREWEEDALTDDVKAWFLGRSGCLERMELLRCPEVVRVFAERLLREGKVAQLVCTD